MKAWVAAQGGAYPAEVAAVVEKISRDGGTPLVVAEDKRVLGVILLKDIVKGGIKERFAQLRKMGITHHHDHRRQSADGRRDRRRGRGG